MKLKKGTLLFLLLTCLAYTALAQTDYTLQGSDVTIDENGIITGCTYVFDTSDDSKGTNLTIPKSVTKDSKTIIIKGIDDNWPGVFGEKNLVSVEFAVGSEVTTIENYAFQNNQITTLSLPEGLTTIGFYAFQNNRITTLSLPEGLTTIGFYAFQNNQITTLSLPTTLTTIGAGAFFQNKIATLTLPTALTTIGDGAFRDNEIATLTLPASLTTIGVNAFLNNQIATLTIPNDAQLTTIGKEAFEGNEDDGGNKITTLALPTTLTTIGEGAFQNNKITTLTFPGNAQLTTIGKEAFWGNQLTTLTLPPSLETIGESAFLNNSLITVTFDDDPNKSNIQSIGINAFSGNTGLTGITLPNHVRGTDLRYKDSEDNNYDPNSVDNNTFTNFERSLVAVLPPHTLTADDVEVDGEGIITKCHCTFLSNRIIIPVQIDGKTITGIVDKIWPDKGVFQDKNLVAVAFQEGSKITAIGGSAFYYNQITELSLPASLTTIGNTAFRNNQITELTFPEDSQLASIGNEAFNFNPLESFTLPSVTIEGYRAYWKDGNSEDLGDNPTINQANFGKSFELDSIELVSLTTKVEGEQGGTISATPNPSLDNQYDIETEVSLTATPDQGWRFDKWVIEGEEKTDNPTTITLDGDKLATAYFVQQITLTLTISGVGLVEGLNAGGNPIDKGTTTVLNAIAESGYRFVSWTIGGEEIQDNPYTLPASDTDISVTVVFDQIPLELQVTLTIAKEGEGTISPDEGANILEKDATATLTATPDEGWKFDKWVIGTEEKTDNPTSITMDGDKSVTAHFVQVVTLTTAVAEQQGGTINPLIDPNGKVYDINTDVELTATPQDGWRFDKWVIGSEDITDNPTTINLDGNKSATAHFVQLVTLTTSVEGEQGGTISATPNPSLDTRYDIKTEVSLTATPNDGWRFDKWVIGSEDITDNPTTITMDTDKTATAHFVEIVTLTVEVNNEEGGSIEPSDDHFTIDKADAPSTQELTATPNDGWRFDKWVIGSEDITDNPTTTTLDSDKTATAHFVQLVTLTTAVAGQQGGTIARSVGPNNDKGEYDINTKVELTATPNEGWKFDKWEISDEEDKTVTNPITLLTLDKNKSVTAHFVEEEEEEEEAITSILTEEVVSANPYPNPVTSQITLKAKDGDLIQLFSQKGKQQYSTQHTGNEVHIIDVSTLPVGVYLVRITDAEGNTTTKRIVKK